MTNKSIIRKQSVDITYDGVIDPFVFRDEVSWLCTTKLIPAIERLFSQYAGDKIICFDDLTIDLGDLPAENWQTVLVERVIDELSIQLGSTSISFDRRWETDKPSAGGAQAVGKQELAMGTSARQCLLYFLKNGTLPWNTSVKSRSELYKLLLDQINDRDELKRLVHKLQTDPVLLKRLVSQFEEDVVEQLIVQFTGMSKSEFSVLKNFVSKLWRDAQASSAPVYALLIENLGTDKSTEKFINDVAAIVIRQPEFLSYVNDLAKTGLSHPQIKDAVLREFKIRSETHVDQWPHAETIRKQVCDRIESILFERKENLIQADHSEVFSFSNRNQKVDKSYEGHGQPEEEWFITNAGLVLLHPFLPMLFENVGYTDDKKWISDDTRHRAMILMQYMLKGEGEYPEFELMLNKILTGYPPEDTLPVHIQLSEFEKQEASDVLASVIKHWSVLKNTTVDGLRSEFLQRDGKLYIEQGSWNLKVQQKTSDILMNRLPWGVSMIKTPWMKTMMQVEWA